MTSEPHERKSWSGPKPVFFFLNVIVAKEGKKKRERVRFSFPG